MCDWLPLVHPEPGTCLQPRPVPGLGIWFAGWCSIHWAPPARAFSYFLLGIFMLFCGNMRCFVVICVNCQDVRETERDRGRERERENHQFVVPLTDELIGRFLYVPWRGIKPATLVYQDEALTNLTRAELRKFYRKIIRESCNYWILEFMETGRCDQTNSLLSCGHAPDGGSEARFVKGHVCVLWH